MNSTELRLEQKPCDEKDLSVIIPVYNDTLKLENVLKSFQNAFQGSSRTYEIILVDNNSPKITEIFQIVQRYKSQIPLTFVMQPQLAHPFSLCGARNRGVLNARGKLIFFTDSDCMVDPAFATEMGRLLDASPSVPRIYTGERIFVKITHEPLDFSHQSSVPNSLERTASASNYGKEKDRRFPWIENLPDQEHPWNFVHGCFILLRKSDYIAVGGSDTAYDGNWGYEEIDLVYRMVQKLSATVHYLPDVKVYHQELPEDLLKISQNEARSNKSQNPNYIRIRDMIAGFDEFKKRQWEHLQIEVS